MASPSEKIHLTRAQVREIDRRSVEDYHVPSIVLMENAARGATDVLLKMIPSPVARVLIICGTGNNGGDGLAMARHLHSHNIAVEILFTSDRLSGDALINWNIARAMQIKMFPAETSMDRIAVGESDIIVDALFGTGLSRTPEGVAALLIDRMNASGLPILAVDVPSGLDCDTGQPLGSCVRAEQTVTFVAEKIGFKNPAARPHLGKVTIADIGCPRMLIDAFRPT